MKLALVHDWLVNLGGAERMLIALHEVFPEAPIYTLFADKKFLQKYLPNAKVITSSLDRAPFIHRWYRFYAPIMPATIESFDFSEFDVVFSSSVFLSKGIITRPQTKHIYYCYSPTRFLWDRTHEYENGGFLLRHFLRLWDRHAAERVDQFIAISKHVQKRISKYYRKSSEVIYPYPFVTPETFPAEIKQGDHFLIVSRIYPHKNFRIIIEAFNKLGYPLIIIGDGPLRKELQSQAASNIRFLGHQDDRVVAKYYAECKAFINPQEEDFGITPVEAMSFGKPVLALRAGGALETIKEGVTGEFFDDPTPEALADGVRRLNENYNSYDPEKIKSHTSQFSKEKFRSAITELVNRS